MKSPIQRKISTTTKYTSFLKTIYKQIENEKPFLEK